MKDDLNPYEPAAPAASVPTLLTAAALARKLDISETPVAAAIAAGRLTPDAVLTRGSCASPSPLFALARLTELRVALGR
jgi:hypothetical protein